ncbi:hypothetical protein GOBAR_AA20000 [Gossypium barbadense]|uniref:SET domain-containing protein n=1 Tax=Gossypium barbadense TaxID=3634 RepID=A0A2P5XBE4_GOSBA|nr:hypothetical protein GOBAR_AA20000 [Gossypium barbadense]
MACTEEAKLEHFLQWLQVNGAQFRGCKIKYCDSTKGFGIYSTNGSPEDGVLLVVPLDLAITPMRVLQDPLIGAECRAMFEEGEVDDRYLDMLPTTFGNPVWFTDDELLELRGTTLYRATELRKKDLMSVYEDKVKELVKKLLVLDGDSESEVWFEDFLWANSIFWSRALNLPLPHSYVFPQIQEDVGTTCPVDKISEGSTSHSCSEEPINEINGKRFEAHGNDSKVNGVTSTSKQEETVWVEGLLPGIDFCNHDLKAVATWEVDGTGSITQIPLSMFLISGSLLLPPTFAFSLQSPLPVDKEVSISYGNKGNEPPVPFDIPCLTSRWLLLFASILHIYGKLNMAGSVSVYLEELLYLYGFVVDNNPDDYLMIHYPGEAIQNISFSDFKGQLLVAQKAAMRCLLPKNLLDHGFFATGSSNCKANNTSEANDRICNFSWSGHRKTPSYLSKLVFPEDFMTALRTIAMKVEEVSKVSAMLEELVGTEGERQPSETEIRTAVWEACGDSGALQLLVDLLQKKMMDLEESSGTEDSDSELLENACVIGNAEQQTSKEANNLVQQKLMSRNRWCSIVYRRGQKGLTRLFLKEAEHALQLSLNQPYSYASIQGQQWQRFRRLVSGNWVVVANNLGLGTGYAKKNKIKLIHEACCNVVNITKGLKIMKERCGAVGRIRQFFQGYSPLWTGGVAFNCGLSNLGNMFTSLNDNKAAALLRIFCLPC